MKRLLILAIAGIVCLSSAGCNKRYTKLDKNEFRINAIGKTKLDITNISGTIEINRSASAEEIIITAQKEVRVRKRDAEKPFDEIEIKLDTNGQTIRVETQYKNEGDGGLFRHGNDERVDYKVTVPENFELDIENMFGNVLVYDISGPVSISVSSGEVDLDNTTGKVIVDMSSGDITANIDSTKGLSLSAVNGDVRLSLSDRIQAKVKADVENGKISYEDLRFDSLFDEKKTLRGKLGISDTEINIDVVNGRVRLLGKKSNVI